MPRQFDFLESFIHRILDEAGFAGLSEATRVQFVPMFVAEAERRLGMALLPLLDDNQSKSLVEITSVEDVSREDLAAFWQKNVPDFEDLVQQTLSDFALEFKQNLANLKK